MLIYDGTYRLPADDIQRSAPISRWTCAWRVRIVDRALAQPEVKHLKPHIVLANQVGGQVSLNSCAESIGRKICRDFNLAVEKAFWVESFPNRPDQWYLATFASGSSFGLDKSYKISWRPIRPNEIDSLKIYFPEFE